LLVNWTLDSVQQLTSTCMTGKRGEDSEHAQ